MTACLESLSPVDISNIMRSVLSLVVMVGVSVKDEEFSAHIDFFHSMHSYAMETTQRDHLFAVMHRPYGQLACLKMVHLPLSQPRSWIFSNKVTRNEDV
jgi:hypothetical protein